MNAGTTDAHFQQEAKEESRKHLLNSFESTGDNSGEHICKTIAGILSGPEADEVSSLKIALATEPGVIQILSNKAKQQKIKFHNQQQPENNYKQTTRQIIPL